MVRLSISRNCQGDDAQPQTYRRSLRPLASPPPPTPPPCRRRSSHDAVAAAAGSVLRSFYSDPAFRGGQRIWESVRADWRYRWATAAAHTRGVLSWLFNGLLARSGGEPLLNVLFFRGITRRRLLALLLLNGVLNAICVQLLFITLESLVTFGDTFVIIIGVYTVAVFRLSDCSDDPSA